jgi:hypothetical protein
MTLRMLFPTDQERAEAAGKGPVGSPAPRMLLKTIDGQQIDLGSVAMVRA